MRVIRQAPDAPARAYADLRKCGREIEDACLGYGTDTTLSALIERIASLCKQEQIDPKGLLPAITKVMKGVNAFFTTWDKELLDSQRAALKRWRADADKFNAC